MRPFTTRLRPVAFEDREEVDAGAEFDAFTVVEAHGVTVASVKPIVYVR
jgi:hypothetical protein